MFQGLKGDKGDGVSGVRNFLLYVKFNQIHESYLQPKGDQGPPGLPGSSLGFGSSK